MSRLGPISHRLGTAAGIPQHLLGRARLVLDTIPSGSAQDCSAAGDHVIAGRTWSTLDTGANEITADADGLIVDAPTGIIRVQIEIPLISAQSSWCVIVHIEPLVLSHQYGFYQLTMCQHATDDTQHDQRISARKGTSTNWRCYTGTRGSGSFSMSNKGDNPIWTDSAVPSRIQLMMYGQGPACVARIGTAATMPGYQGVVATSNADVTLRSGSGTSTAPVEPLYRYIRIGAKGYNASGQAKMRIRHVRAWILGE